MMKKILPILVLLSFSGYHSCDNESDSDDFLTARIDHFVVYYRSMHEVDSMFLFFHEELGVPAWFSPKVRDVASKPGESFYNGIVYLGNVFLEFISFDTDNPNKQAKMISPYYHAIAYADQLENMAGLLALKEIAYAGPDLYAFSNHDDEVINCFKNVYIMEPTGSINIFFCKYLEGLFTHPQFKFDAGSNISNGSELHDVLKKKVKNANGGQLGIIEVDRIILSSSITELQEELFSLLYHPSATDNSTTWFLPEGPAMQLVEDDRSSDLRPYAMIIKVQSLSKARDCLSIKNQEYIEIDDNLKLVTISRNLGLDVFLTN